MTDKEICDLNVWKVGDVLVGTEMLGHTKTDGVPIYWTDRILITAIGEKYILAKVIWSEGLPVKNRDEGTWSLQCREWKKLCTDKPPCKYEIGCTAYRENECSGEGCK